MRRLNICDMGRKDKALIRKEGVGELPACVVLETSISPQRPDKSCVSSYCLFL